MRLEDMMRAGNRYEVLLKVERGILRMWEAAKLLRVSERQCRRLKRRSERGGLKGLLYQRGHEAWNRVSDEEKKAILDLRRKYGEYNLLHFREILKRQYSIERSWEYYRRLFSAAGLYRPAQKRRKRKHRKRFEAPQAGILIQRDTSIHLWIPGAVKPWKLILDLDDHSRKITGAYFSEHDDVLSNMLVAWETIETHGMPMAYYTDNNPIFNPMNQKPKEGMYSFYRRREWQEKDSLTQFKRSLTELGIEMIHATPYQPQGKGKVERIFRFMQDRLVKEMVTAKVKTIQEANKYLKKWVEWYNHCHLHSTTGMIPNERYLRADGFRKKGSQVNLEEIFCLKYERQVKADNTFQLDGFTYQVPAGPQRISYAKAKVEVRVYLTKIVKVFYKNQEIGRFIYKHNKNNYLESRADILALE